MKITTVLLITFMLTGCMSQSRAQTTLTSNKDIISRSNTAVNQTQEVAIMTMILAGEIAVQYGNIAVAASYMNEAAKLSNDPALSERSARLSVSAQELSGSIAAVERWSRNQPSNKEAQHLLAVLYMRKGREGDAIQVISSLIKGAKNSTDIFNVISSLLQKETNKAAGISLLEKIAKKHSSDKNAQLALAQLYIKSKKYDQGLKVLEQLLKQKPTWNKAILLKASILQDQGKTEDALNFLYSVIKAQPKSYFMRSAYARLLVDAKKFNPAIKEFEKLRKVKPNDNTTNFPLAMLYLQNKELKKSKVILKGVMKNSSNIADSNKAAYFIGQIEEEQRNFAEAIKSYQSIKKGEYYIDARVKSAILQSKNNLDKAIQHLQASNVRTLQQQLKLLLAEAAILEDAKRYKEAMLLMEDALELNPHDADMLYSYAMVADKAGRIDIVEESLVQVIKQEPNNFHALNALGYMLADRTTRYNDALKYIKRALKLRPEDFYVLDSIGWVEYRLGNYQTAIKYLKKALSKKQDAEVSAHLGEVLWQSGKQQQAKKVWEKAKKLDPNHPILTKTIKRFIR